MSKKHTSCIQFPKYLLLYYIRVYFSELGLPLFETEATNDKPVTGNVRQTIEIPFNLGMPYNATLRTKVIMK